jgi:hypothetical protein
MINVIGATEIPVEWAVLSKSEKVIGQVSGDDEVCMRGHE